MAPFCPRCVWKVLYRVLKRRTIGHFAESAEGAREGKLMRGIFVSLSDLSWWSELGQESHERMEPKESFATSAFARQALCMYACHVRDDHRSCRD